MAMIMLDTNAYDDVASDATLKADIEALQTAGSLVAIYTHVEAGELKQIPFGRDIGQATAVTRRRVGAAVFVLDHGRLDEDSFGTPEADALFNNLQTQSPDHVADGMIAATALAHGATLITNDKRLRNRMAEHAPNVEVMHSNGLRALVERLKASS